MNKPVQYKNFNFISQEQLLLTEFCYTHKRVNIKLYEVRISNRIKRLYKVSGLGKYGSVPITELNFSDRHPDDISDEEFNLYILKYSLTDLSL